jgi:hypothetical protein
MNVVDRERRAQRYLHEVQDPGAWDSHCRWTRRMFPRQSTPDAVAEKAAEVGLGAVGCASIKLVSVILPEVVLNFLVTTSNSPGLTHLALNPLQPHPFQIQACSSSLLLPPTEWARNVIGPVISTAVASPKRGRRGTDPTAVLHSMRTRGEI